jgi:hypothetical protein
VFSTIVERMVERAMPGVLGERHHELIAAEAAENAVRQTARLAFLAGLFVLLLAAGLGYWFVFIPGRQVAATPAVPSESLKQLARDNEKLSEQNQELQNRIDALTKEREALTAVQAELRKQGADLTKQPGPAEPPGAASPPAPHDVPAASKPAARPRPAAAPRVAARAATHRKPAGARPATARIQSGDSFHCGDGRTVPDPAACASATASAPPRDRLDPRHTYRCGDGRTAHDPAQCRSPRVSRLAP